MKFSTLSIGFHLISLFISCEGGRIAFTANPVNITEGLSNFKIRCSLEKTVHSNTVVSPTNDVTDAAQSIVIKKDHEVVVRVSSGQQVELGQPGIDAALNYNMAENQENGVIYLEMTWTKPDDKQAGNYICEINLVGSAGTPIQLTSSFDVSYVRPPFDDLVLKVKELKHLLETSNQGFLKTLNEMNKTINGLQNNLNALEVYRIEQFVIEADYSDEWPIMFGVHRQYLANMKFKTPYRKIPFVTLSVVKIDFDHKFNARYSFDVYNLTTNGFQLQILTRVDSVIYYLQVQCTCYGV